MDKKEIKTTSELGCMLDTERPWVSVEDRLPINERTVSVLLKNNVETVGWYFSYWSVNKEYNIPQNSVDFWSTEHPNNPVVAWRELVTDNTEKA